MKLSLVALVAGCAVASSAFAVMDSPPTLPPGAAVMDSPPTLPPGAAVLDSPPTLPPGAAVMGLPRTNARHHA
jgi:hypothetical protein